MKTQFVFKYIYENDHEDDMHHREFANNKEVVVTLNGEQSLKQIFEEFKGFLQSAGYAFGMNDYIDKINDFEPDALPPEDNEVWDDGGSEDGSSFSGRDQEVYGENYKEFSEVQNGGEVYSLNDKPASDVNYDIRSERDLNEALDEFLSVKPSPYNISLPTALNKISKLEEEILPFLENLKKDPEKTMLRWPNRAEVVDKQIQKIKDIIQE